MERQPETYQFESFTLDLANRQLRRDGEPVELGSRYFDALVLLAGEGGGLVSKDRFMETVWRGIPVTDEALTQCIRTLRRALGDDAGSPRFIQTVPKHGYRFVAPVHGSHVADAPPGATKGQRLPSRLAGASTIAGALAGGLGGLVYAMIAGTGGTSATLVLAAMVSALGTLAGAGIGATLAGTLVWRGRTDAFLIAGGGGAGLLTGLLGSELGREGLNLLTGETVGTVTGPFEGVAIGLAAGISFWLVLAYGWRGSKALAASVALGGLTGLLLHAGGGVLLGGSLWSLQQALGGSRLALEALGTVFGEAGFGARSHLLTAMLECAVFIGALTVGALWSSRGDNR